MSVLWREQAARSDGRRTYRARRRPSVSVFEDGWGSGGVLVTRTHDVDVAVALAADEYLANWDGPLPSPNVCWQRLVPWDTTGSGEFGSSWTAATDSTPGAIPCVVFYRP